MVLAICTNTKDIFSSRGEKVTTLLIRTTFIYILLIIVMRLMGKRQIGELEISDLVTTLLISEIASLPITDNSIPLSHAIVPIIVLTTFEVMSSALIAAFPGIKNLITARPATLIRDGRLCGRAMRQSRISADELVSELRQKDITDLSEVRYAILEQNGKITVIPKAKHRPPTCEQLHIKVKDPGLYHIIIDKGVINRHNLTECHLTQKQLVKQLSQKGIRKKDVYLMMLSDTGETKIILKKEV